MGTGESGKETGPGRTPVPPGRSPETVPSLSDSMLFAFLLPYPMAVLCALLYHFPFPLADNPIAGSQAWMALITVLWLQLFGGAFVCLLVGGFAHAIARREAKRGGRRARRVSFAICAAFSLAAVVFFATMHLWAGAW